MKYPGSAPRSKRKTPGFPLGVLPPKARNYAIGARDVLGVHPDFLAASMIFTAGAAAGNTCFLEAQKGVNQKAVQYLILVGGADAQMKAALKVALRPLLDKNAAEFEQYQSQAATYLAERAARDADTGRAKTKKNGRELGKPVFKRLLIKDSSLQTVANALRENPRGITLYRDDLSRFLKDLNQPGHSSAALYARLEDRQAFWRDAWAGNFLCSDRQKNEPLMIKDPFLPVAGSITPQVLTELKALDKFMGRFLFCQPGELKKPKRQKPGFSFLQAEEAYQRAASRLLNLRPGRGNKPRKLTLGAKARKALFQFFNEDLKPLCEYAKDELLSAMYGKMDLHCLRLAAALHLLHWAYGDRPKLSTRIDAQTADRAIKATRYFQAQALKAYWQIKDA